MKEGIKVNLPKDVEVLLNSLHDNGFEGYVVGGCVRDSLLGRTPNDWDICTNATPDEMMSVFTGYKIIPTGLKHGTITIVLNNISYEVTTFRVDGKYSDNRRPDSVNFTESLQEDLSRRDFTINALAYSHQVGLVDFYDGTKDLRFGIIRCVGNPDDRFEEDALRMLRAVRFASQLGFKIDDATSESIYRYVELLQNVSAERVRDELNKILTSKKPSIGIELLSELVLLDYIIPELEICKGFNQYSVHHDKDVFGHTMAVLDYVEPKLELRLSALFHDIGKPNAFTLGENGAGHFYSHHKESAKICRDIMTRLKYSNKEIEYVSELVYHHMTRYEKLRPASAKRFINKVGTDKLDDLFRLFIADRVGSSPPYSFEDIYKLKFECEKILSEKQPLGLKDLAINGSDLIELGFSEGKEIGSILIDLLEMVLENPNINQKSLLVEMVKDIKKLQ